MSVTNPYISTSAVYGPVNSRRLGRSLGINFFVNKVCNYNCIYCYLGKTLKGVGEYIPAHLIIDEFKTYMEEHGNVKIDYITFCGNGEPTVHPEFSYVVREIIQIKDIYRKGIPTALFSNATTLHINEVFETIKLIDRKFFKFDIVNPDLFNLINKPDKEIDFKKVIDNLKLASSSGVKYTLDAAIITYLLPVYTKNNSKLIDEWLNIVFDINPPEVNLYTIVYHPDIFEEDKLKRKLKESKEDIQKIANYIKDQLEKGGIPCKIYI